MNSGAKVPVDTCWAGVRRLALLTAAIGAIAAAFTAQGASARVPHDPCGTDHAAHVTGHLHCGRVFEIPGHRTWKLPTGDEAHGCDPVGGVIGGLQFYRGQGLGGNWDYWTRNGEWVLWDGRGHFVRGVHGQPINVIPTFHNWGGSPWEVRVYLTCDSLGRHG